MSERERRRTGFVDRLDRRLGSGLSLDRACVLERVRRRRRRRSSGRPEVVLRSRIAFLVRVREAFLVVRLVPSVRGLLVILVRVGVLIIALVVELVLVRVLFVLERLFLGFFTQLSDGILLAERVSHREPLSMHAGFVHPLVLFVDGTRKLVEPRGLRSFELEPWLLHRGPTSNRIGTCPRGSGRGVSHRRLGVAMASSDR